jgi:hypothetical protein
MTVVLKLGNSSIALDASRPRVFAGRDPSACQLAYLDGGLSRRHADIWLDPQGQVCLRDLGSSNGTWVDGQPLGPNPVFIQPGAHVFLGTIPLGIEWQTGGQTQMVAMPAELRQMIEARQQQAAAIHASPPPVAAPAATGMIATMGTPAELSYRRQGANDNGVLLLALKQDTFWNGSTIEGYVEFTSTDHQTVASIAVELVELHGTSDGHVWDRALVRQGPWRAANGDVVPLPFALQVPQGTSISGRNVQWEIRGQADINWAVDVDCALPIHMRNTDIERVRDAFGALDYRLAEMDSARLGQRFTGTFQPPANLRSQLGINDIKVIVEYLGATIKVAIHVDKRGIFHSDKDVAEVYDLARFRASAPHEVVQHFAELIQKMMA